MVDGEVTDSQLIPRNPADVTDHRTADPGPKIRGERKPLIAPWLKDPTEFTGTVGGVLRRAGHTVMWHILHTPMHVGQILRYSPGGGKLVVRGVWGWVFHAESKPLRQLAVLRSDSPEWRALERERKERVSLRWRAAVVLLLLLGIVGVLMWWLAPLWMKAASIAVVVLGFGFAGRPKEPGKRLIAPATDVSGDERITNDIIVRGLCSLGIARMTKPEEIELLYGVKPARAGYNIDIQLPFGVTATSVMAKREEFSSAIRRSIGTVWPSVGPRHAGHLVFFISHEDMSKSRQKPWPLLKSGTVDLFTPVPMFTDQRGDWVSLRIATKSGVVGAIPRMGKTYYLRELGLVCGLDVRCDLYTFELKCSGDMSSHKLFAHYYSDSDEPEDIEEHLVVMRKLKAERRRRTNVIKDLPDERCPRSEVTSELASDRSLGLHPIVVIIDECQTWTEHSVKAVREEFVTIIEELVRKGPAVAIHVYLATQKVDANSIPTKISTNATVRLCFKVQDATSNNQILGPGSYANGIQATMFDFEKDKGIAYLRDGGPAQIVRTVFSLDKVESEKVALRARGLREQAGRLTGYAAGEEMDHEAEQVVLLDDARQVMGNSDALHLVDIAVGLAELRPLLYGNLDAASLGAQLRRAGVRVDSVYVAGKPREQASNKGVKREWLDVASTLLVGDEEEATRDEEEDPAGARDNVRPLRRLTDDDLLTGRGRPS